MAKIPSRIKIPSVYYHNDKNLDERVKEMLATLNAELVSNTDYTELQADMQQRLEHKLTKLKEAHAIIREADSISAGYIEPDMMQLNGLIASIIGKLEYQHAQNARVLNND